MEFNSEEDIKNVSLDDLIEEDEDDSLGKRYAADFFVWSILRR